MALGGVTKVREKLISTIGRAKSRKVFPGYLLVSGSSFHYIGLELMTFSEWLELLGLCLLYEEGRDLGRPSVVDRRWIGWSLIRQFGSLRIFGWKDKPEPCVVEHFPSITVTCL